MSRAPVRILMVCMGNICRSPTAEGVLRHKLQQRGWTSWVQVDSAGTHGWHEGAPPDVRSQRHALDRGYDLSEQRSRPVRPSDFEAFDWVLAMDHDNVASLMDMAPASMQFKVRLLLSFAAGAGAGRSEVPDPYSADARAFEHVLDLIELGCDGLLAALEPSSSH